MENYEFKCERCGTVFTSEMVIGEEPGHFEIECPRCGSPEVQQLFGSMHAQTSNQTSEEQVQDRDTV